MYFGITYFSWKAAALSCDFALPFKGQDCLQWQQEGACYVAKNDGAIKGKITNSGDAVNRTV